MIKVKMFKKDKQNAFFNILKTVGVEFTMSLLNGQIMNLFSPHSRQCSLRLL